MKLDLKNLNKGQTIKWVFLILGAAFLIVIFVFGVKWIKRLFGFEEEEEDQPKRVDLDIDISGLGLDLFGIAQHDVDEIAKMAADLFRVLDTDYWWVDPAIEERCSVYQRVDEEIDDNELRVLAKIYDQAFDQNLQDAVRAKAVSGCSIFGTDYRKKLLKRLEEL